MQLQVDKILNPGQVNFPSVAFSLLRKVPELTPFLRFYLRPYGHFMKSKNLKG